MLTFFLGLLAGSVLGGGAMIVILSLCLAARRGDEAAKMGEVYDPLRHERTL